MRSKKPLFILLYMLFLSFKGAAQGLTTSESDSAQWRTYIFIQNNKAAADTIGSEYLFIVLETNHDSKITGVHILADPNNQGKIYKIVTKLTPQQFDGWKPKNFPNATIAIPLYNMGMDTKKNYADKTLFEGTPAGQNSKIIWQNKSSALTSGILVATSKGPRQY